MRLIFFILLLSCLSSCWLIRAYRIRTLKLTDHKKLPSVAIAKPGQSFYFIEATEGYLDLKKHLDSELAQTQTAAFLIIKNDSLIYEKYFNGFSKDIILP